MRSVKRGTFSFRIPIHLMADIIASYIKKDQAVAIRPLCSLMRGT